MKVRPVTINYSDPFTGRKRTPMGATYDATNKGTISGFVIGTAISGTLIGANLRDLSTYKGKRCLIENLQNKGKCLNDLSKKVVMRNDDGKILPHPTISERSRKLIRNTKLSMFLAGAGLIALFTGFGKLTDINKNLLRARKADDCISCKN